MQTPFLTFLCNHFLKLNWYAPFKWWKIYQPPDWIWHHPWSCPSHCCWHCCWCCSRCHHHCPTSNIKNSRGGVHKVRKTFTSCFSTFLLWSFFSSKSSHNYCAMDNISAPRLNQEMSLLLSCCYQQKQPGGASLSWKQCSSHFLPWSYDSFFNYILMHCACHGNILAPRLNPVTPPGSSSLQQ